ncbi:MAG: alpha/beta fold hydrolase [Kofleriaceae bacterium]
MYAGIRDLVVDDPVQGVRVPAWLVYPTAGEPRTERFGPYSLDVARDAAMIGTGLRVVVISHGTGSTPWAYRGMATALAVAGFAVILVEHPGDSRRDNSLANTDANLVNRPRHLRLAIDAALADPGLAPDRVAVIGHSLGGYTALAVAGGRAMNLPPAISRSAPLEELARHAYPIATEADPRIAAAVLLAPAIGFFMAETALAAVTAPVLVRTGEHDAICATAAVRFALRSHPGRIDLVEVAGANHFAFQSPFPPELVRPEFPPSQDSPGFDRAAYQRGLYDEVAAFLAQECVLPSGA